LSDSQTVNGNQVLIFASLLRNLQIDPALAKRTADAVALAEPPPPVPAGSPTPPPPPKVPMQLRQVEDLLVIPGYTQEIVAKLREFVIVLPGDPKPKLNVNTAPPELLAAVIQGYSLSEGTALAARRKQAYFLDMNNFLLQLQGKQPIDADKLDVKSDFFLVQSKIRLDRANLDSEALVERKPGTSPTVVSIRQN
jgi:general secretion pathway protein K